MYILFDLGLITMVNYHSKDLRPIWRLKQEFKSKVYKISSQIIFLDPYLDMKPLSFTEIYLVTKSLSQLERVRQERPLYKPKQTSVKTNSVDSLPLTPTMTVGHPSPVPTTICGITYSVRGCCFLSNWLLQLPRFQISKSVIWLTFSPVII